VPGDDWRPTATVATLTARARALADIRAFFVERGVLEVDTPVLGRTTVTDVAIESLATVVSGTPYYLQTSPEYHMKRLLAAGAPSIVRIGPVFRAEESGRLHNPEFTMIEWYRLGYTLDALMDETAALVARVLGSAPVRRSTYAALLEGVGVPGGEASRTHLMAAVKAIGASGAFETWTDRELSDFLIAEAIRRHGRGRLFVTDYPPEQAALARLIEDARGRTVAARFELVVDGVEIANGYDELADADALAARMAGDLRARAARAQPLHTADERLLDALRAGLPACAGVALGFDRLLMLALDANALADVMPFAGRRG
jgi:lysyl-tRNA synthetase class 2